MACHKTLKAGDMLYVGNVRIRTSNKTYLSVDANKDTIIIHATETKEHNSQETTNEQTT